mmetsp:Transcript_13596/g.43894  ORF Transcript_13596/g.43894 Transcript_13596/m.43894 type:complete len:228 (+) Transcript_13596:192-875(+)
MASEAAQLRRVHRDVRRRGDRARGGRQRRARHGADELWRVVAALRCDCLRHLHARHSLWPAHVVHARRLRADAVAGERGEDRHDVSHPHDRPDLVGEEVGRCAGREPLGAKLEEGPLAAPPRRRRAEDEGRAEADASRRERGGEGALKAELALPVHVDRGGGRHLSVRGGEAVVDLIGGEEDEAGVRWDGREEGGALVDGASTRWVPFADGRARYGCEVQHHVWLHL